MYSTRKAGDLAKATALHKELYKLCKAMFCETNPIPVKVRRVRVCAFRGPMHACINSGCIGMHRS